MEQLVWAIIIIIFIIFTALKNRARNRPDTSTDRTSDTEHQTEEKRDKLGRYLEEILGVEIPMTEPQISAEEEVMELLEKRVELKPEPEIEEKVCEPELAPDEQIEEEWNPHVPEKKDLYSAKFPWGTLSGKNLKNAIIFAEILGPPISKRKNHRLF